MSWSVKNQSLPKHLEIEIVRLPLKLVTIIIITTTTTFGWDINGGKNFWF